jgi:hypothetical protein
MPIDPSTGIFSNAPVSYQPNSTSPVLGGLLSLLNNAAGQRNRQMALMQQYQAQEPSGIFDTGPGQAQLQAGGISPQDTQTLQQGLPSTRLRNAFAEIQTRHPKEPFTNDEIMEAYQTANLPAPPGLWGYMGRVVAQQGKEKLADIRENVEVMKEFGLSVARQKRLGYQGADAAARAAQEVAPFYHLTPDQIQALTASGAGSAQAPTVTADIALKTQRADTLRALTDPSVKLKMAQVGLTDEHTKLTKMLEQIKQADLSGVPVTVEQKATVMKALTAMEDKLSTAAGVGAAKAQLGGPAGVAQNRAVAKQLLENIQQARAMLSAGAEANEKAKTPKGAIAVAPKGIPDGPQSMGGKPVTVKGGYVFPAEGYE